MKTLIAFAGKYGTTEKCANELAGRLPGEIVLADLRAAKAPNLQGFDRVIIGSGVNFGQIQKAVKAFCNDNLSALQTKETGVFLCCGFPENADQLFSANFPPELLKSTKAHDTFGGEMDIAKLRGIDRFVAKMVTTAATKDGKALPSLARDRIEKFISLFLGDLGSPVELDDDIATEISPLHNPDNL